MKRTRFWDVEAGALFFLSGAAGLVYQTVWQRQLVMIYGSTVYATGAVLGSFMAGLAVGSALGGRWLRRRPRTTLRTYGYAEWLIALGGFLSLGMPPLHAFLVRNGLGFLPMGYRAYLVKSAVIFPFIGLPTLAMGATFPLFVRAWTRGVQSAGARVSAAYSLNTLGAVGGTLAAAFILIPVLGLRGTLLAAACVNLLVGLAAVVHLGRDGRAEEDTGAQSENGNHSRTAGRLERRGWFPLGIYFFAGYAAITLEIVWTRILVLHLGSSVYAYALMLALVLLGIALGSFLVARWADVWDAKVWALVLAGIAFALVLNLYQLQQLGSVISAMVRAFRPGRLIPIFSVYGVAIFQALVLPTLGMGLAFPLGIRILSRTVREVAVRGGYLYAANTAGAIVAGLAAPLLLGHLGENTVISACAGIYLLLAAGVFTGLAVSRRFVRVGVWAAASVLMVLGGWIRPRLPVSLHANVYRSPDHRWVDYLEGATGFVAVAEVNAGWYRYKVLEINGVNVAGTSIDLRMIQKMQGHLPLLLHPEPRDVLHIGFGSGGTAYAVSLHPVRTIDVVEISPDVVTMAKRYFQEVNHRVWEDSRVHFLWGDGRNYLLGTSKTYDVILSDSIHPKYAGNGTLYTLEYFRLAADRLRRNGVFSMWLPLYSLTPANFQEILAAFHRVFPRMYVWYFHSTINNYVVVTGFKDPRPFPPPGRWRMTFYRPRVFHDLMMLGYSHPLAVIDNLVIGPAGWTPALEGVKLHRDNRPVVEFESSRVFNREFGWIENFRWIYRHRESWTKYVHGPLPWAGSLVLKYRQAQERVLRGQMEFLSCHTVEAKKDFQAALRILPAHREPWEFARYNMLDRLRLRHCRDGSGGRPSEPGSRR